MLASTEELGKNLSLAPTVDDESLNSLNDLLHAYEEGWFTLNEFLTAIEIEVTGMKNYTDQVILYFENLFELEAITATTLVTFAE